LENNNSNFQLIETGGVVDQTFLILNRLCNKIVKVKQPYISISSGQQNLMKTYHNEASNGGITKIASKLFLEFFGQSR
jgi:hypothetical protein